MDYNLLWFVLVGVLFAGYAMLDGFDLGVGALILRIDDDHERRVFYNAIGPVWDGNEVWLVTGGGALFAAFPPVYATVFSGFYMAFMLLLFALIFRAVAIEFRSKEPWPWWRRWWDRGFCAGNIVWGIPLDANGEFAGSFLGLLQPYPLLMGVTTVALFMMHGAIYLHLKTEGDLQAKVRSWINPLIIAFIVCFALTTLATLLYVPRMVRILQAQPALFGVVVALVLVVANLPREIHRNRDAAAFVSSCLTMLLLMALFGLGMFPHLVYSVPDPTHSLTAYNASSTDKTLRIMTIIAAIGVPIVLAYTVSVYYIFRGKVKIGKDSY